MDSRSVGTRSIASLLDDAKGGIWMDGPLDAVDPLMGSMGPMGMHIDASQMEAFANDENGHKKYNAASGSYDDLGLDDPLWDPDDMYKIGAQGELGLNDEDDTALDLKPPAQRSQRSTASVRLAAYEEDNRSVGSKSTRSVHSAGALLHDRAPRPKKAEPKQMSVAERLSQFGHAMTKVRSNGSLHALPSAKIAPVNDRKSSEQSTKTPTANKGDMISGNDGLFTPRNSASSKGDTYTEGRPSPAAPGPATRNPPPSHSGATNFSSGPRRGSPGGSLGGIIPPGRSHSGSNYNEGSPSPANEYNNKIGLAVPRPATLKSPPPPAAANQFSADSTWQRVPQYSTPPASGPIRGSFGGSPSPALPASSRSQSTSAATAPVVASPSIVEARKFELALRNLQKPKRTVGSWSQTPSSHEPVPSQNSQPIVTPVRNQPYGEPSANAPSRSNSAPLSREETVGPTVKPECRSPTKGPSSNWKTPFDSASTISSNKKTSKKSNEDAGTPSSFTEEAGSPQGKASKPSRRTRTREPTGSAPDRSSSFGAIGNRLRRVKNNDA